MRSGAVLLLALMAQQAAPERIVRSGETIPDDVRPCIDHVGRGSLRLIGVDPIDDPEDLLGHAVYRWRFREKAAVVGRWTWPDHVLAVTAHTRPTGPQRDALVFVARDMPGGGARWVGRAWIWRDERGEDFVPVFGWPDRGARGTDWMPDAARRFARPVRYRWPQPFGSGEPLTPDDDEPGLVETRHGRTRVLYGIYLRDMPAMMAAARAEECWR